MVGGEVNDHEGDIVVGGVAAVLEHLIDDAPADLRETQASLPEAADAIYDAPLRHAAVESISGKDQEIVRALERVLSELRLAEDVLLKGRVAKSARHIDLSLYFRL